MSDNITTARQRSCTALDCDHEKYIVDFFSCMEPGRHGQHEARKQLFLYITRAEGNGRKGFLQEEQISLGLLNVHSDRFCWNREEQAATLVAQLEMGDFQAIKRVERKKIDEMKLPEKLTYTLPTSDASSMKIRAKLLSGNFDTLLETEELKINLAFSFPRRNPSQESSMSAEQTSQWKRAVKLRNKCTRDYPALRAQVQLRDLSACGNAKKFVIGWRGSVVSGSQQVTLETVTSSSHEQQSQKVCLTEDNNYHQLRTTSASVV